MDFSEYDKINDFELNYVLWHAVMGENAPQPPAVRRAIAFRPSRRRGEEVRVFAAEGSRGRPETAFTHAASWPSSRALSRPLR
jgi:hypothetical protein